METIKHIMPNEFDPFNGDNFVCQEVLKLQKKYGIKVAVETGSAYGGTTGWLCKHFSKVHTVEINREFHVVMMNRLRACTNLKGYLGDSAVLINQIIENAKRDAAGTPILFFIDSHWGAVCPMQKELVAIQNNAKDSVLVIHDFKVPNQPKLGFDTWQGKDLDFNFIQPHLQRIYPHGYEFHYNTDAQSTAVKRGLIYVYPKLQIEQMAEKEEPMPEIQKAQPKQPIIPDEEMELHRIIVENETDKQLKVDIFSTFKEDKEIPEGITLEYNSIGFDYAEFCNYMNNSGFSFDVKKIKIEAVSGDENGADERKQTLSAIFITERDENMESKVYNIIPQITDREHVCSSNYIKDFVLNKYTGIELSVQRNMTLFIDIMGVASDKPETDTDDTVIDTIIAENSSEPEQSCESIPEEIQSEILDDNEFSDLEGLIPM